jgi:hypothetical protein
MKILQSYLMVTLSLLVGQCTLHAQEAKPPKEIVQTATQAELAADMNDHTRWRYRDAKKDGTDTVSIVVETDYGSVKRVIMRNGQPLNEAEARAEDERVQRFIHDPEKLAKQKRDGLQDGKNAEELLHMLPEAFIWKLVSEDAQRYTLHFEPNPSFTPPNMQGRVLGTMAGTLVVNKAQHRIETISGKLTEDVTIGWGLLGGCGRAGRSGWSAGRWLRDCGRLSRLTCTSRERRCSSKRLESSRMRCRQSLRRCLRERRWSRRRRCRSRRKEWRMGRRGEGSCRTGSAFLTCRGRRDVTPSRWSGVRISGH